MSSQSRRIGCSVVENARDVLDNGRLARRMCLLVMRVVSKAIQTRDDIADDGTVAIVSVCVQHLLYVGVVLAHGCSCHPHRDDGGVFVVSVSVKLWVTYPL